MGYGVPLRAYWKVKPWGTNVTFGNQNILKFALRDLWTTPFRSSTWAVATSLRLRVDADSHQRPRLSQAGQHPLLEGASNSSPLFSLFRPHCLVSRLWPGLAWPAVRARALGVAQ